MSESPYSFWLPLNASAHGAEIDSLISVIHWFMAVLFVGWGIYFVYCLVRFRERLGHSPVSENRHFKLPTYLEVVIAIIEVVLLVFISYPIWKKVKTGFPPASEALRVRITAEQFAWNIQYPGDDGKFGKTDASLIDGTNPIGLDRNDPDAKDDIFVINDFHVPINKPVIVDLSSKDVIHSFGIPVMRVKQDIIPGMTIPVWFEANKGGQFEIACAQLCGVGHYRMRGQFYVDTPEQYNTWMENQKIELREMMGDASSSSSEGGN